METTLHHIVSHKKAGEGLGRSPKDGFDHTSKRVGFQDKNHETLVKVSHSNLC